MDDNKVFYECDPAKNTICKKHGCQELCFRTSREEFSAAGADGHTAKEWEQIDKAKKG